MPKVSVIIPVYNVEEYLSECLDSLINQTLRDIEIICINDGSTDNSLNILNEYAKKDSRITVLTQENQGAAVARNKGLDFAKGEYLSILDSDDFFELNMLEKLYNRAVETDAEIVICRETAVDFENDKKCEFSFRGEIMPNKPVFSGRETKENAFAISRNIAWEKLFKASFIFGNNIRFHNVRIIDDAHFVFVAYALANRITTVDASLVFHRINISGQQTNPSNFNISKTRVKDLVFAYDKIRDSLCKHNLYEIYEQTYINALCGDIRHYLSKLNIINKLYLIKYLKSVLFPKINILEKDIYFYNTRNAYYVIQNINNPLYIFVVLFKRLYLIFLINNI